MNLKEKTILITGASDGIGKQIAISLAVENTKLILIWRNTEKLKDTQKLVLSAWANKAEIYSCDVSDNNAIRTTLSQINQDFESIDVLINNAGIWQKLMPLEQISQDTIQNVIQTNLTGLINMTQAVLPILKKQSEAAIINISSKAWIVGQQWLSVYNASKFWVTGFTEALKLDLKGTRVRVAGIYQAGINTKMFENTWEDFPVEKFSEPEDLASVVKFMLMQPAKIWLHDVRVEY